MILNVAAGADFGLQRLAQAGDFRSQFGDFLDQTVALASEFSFVLHRFAAWVLGNDSNVYQEKIGHDKWPGFTRYFVTNSLMLLYTKTTVGQIRIQE